MTLQRDIFLAGEGRAWLERNRDKLGQHDPVSDLIEAQGIEPKKILEIGCADGWRLKKLNERYGCHAAGIDPSTDRFLRFSDDVCVMPGTADQLPVYSQFDLVIFGFCLYLCDPWDYFRIVAESDRVLQDGGHLVIHDFAPEPDGAATATPYKHHPGVLSRRLDWWTLWEPHPAYTLVTRKIGDMAADWSVTLLRKDLKGAFRDAQPLG